MREDELTADDLLAHALRMRTDGATLRQIAKHFDCSLATARNWIDGLKYPSPMAVHSYRYLERKRRKGK